MEADERRCRIHRSSLGGASATLLGLGTGAIQVKVRARASRLRKNRTRMDPLSLRAEPFVNTSLVALLSTANQQAASHVTLPKQSATNTVASSASMTDRAATRRKRQALGYPKVKYTALLAPNGSANICLTLDLACLRL